MILLDDEIMAVLNGRMEMEHFFIYLLQTADNGILNKSYSDMANDTGLTVQTIRGCVERLKQNEICLTGVNKVTKHGVTRNTLQITVCNIERYITSEKPRKQGRNKETTRTIAKPKPTQEEQLAAMEERKRQFGLSLQPYQEKYGREMLTDFYRYWTEPEAKHGNKMRFEMEKTWSTAGRLATWAGNQRIFKPKNNSNGSGTTTEERLSGAAALIAEIRNGDTTFKG